VFFGRPKPSMAVHTNQIWCLCWSISCVIFWHLALDFFFLSSTASRNSHSPSNAHKLSHSPLVLWNLPETREVCTRACVCILGRLPVECEDSPACVRSGNLLLFCLCLLSINDHKADGQATQAAAARRNRLAIQ